MKEGRKIMEEYSKDALDASNDEEVIGLYDRELHLEMLKNTEIHEALEKGLQEGKEIGLEEGKKAGIQEGKLEIVKMLDQGFTIEEIKKRIGMDVSFIDD